MIVHTAHLTCRPDAIEAFRTRLLQHASITQDAEPGCHLFAVHQDRDEPTRFLLVEHYSDADALEAHRTAPHYLRFREDTNAWVVDRQWWFWNPLD